MSIMTRRPRMAALLVIPALLLALGACSSPTPQPSPTDAGGDTPKALSFSDWRLANVACMREQGVDMPDPTGDGTVALGAPAGNEDAMVAASKVCFEKLGPPPALSNDEKAEMDAKLQKMMIAMAECYRENGIDVPDPKPGEQLKAPTDVPEDVLAECGRGGAVSGSATEE